MALALVAAKPASAEIHEITEGQLTWGVKESWRNYVGGGEVSEGAILNGDGTFTFPLESGTFDDETNTAVLNFAGQVWFRAWWEYTEPGKWALDTTFRDLQVIIGPDEQTIRGTHIGYSQDDPGGELHHFEDAHLGSINLLDGDVDFTGGTTSWSKMSVRAGSGLGLYGPGTPIDPATITYTGPGAMPDLGEHLDTPGSISLAEGERHLSDWVRETVARSNREVFASADGEALHFVEIKNAHNANTAMRFTRLDPETLEVVGTPLVLDDYPVFNGNRFYGRYFRVAYIPDTDELFFVKGGLPDDDPAAPDLGVSLFRATWDANTETYAVAEIAALPDATINVQGTNVIDTPVGPLVWNEVLNELAFLGDNPSETDVYDQNALFRFQRDGSDWRAVVSSLRAPDSGEWANATRIYTPWSYVSSSSAIMTYNDFAVARDGSYIVPSHTASIYQPNPEGGADIATLLPSAHIAIDGNDATPQYIDGTIVGVHPGFDYNYGWSAASSSYDGSVLIHNSQWGQQSFVRIDIVDSEAEVVGDIYMTTDDMPPYQVSTMGRTVDADPARGWDWLTSFSDPDGYVLHAFRQIDGEDTRFSRHQNDEMLSGQAVNNGVTVAPNGDVYFVGLNAETDSPVVIRMEFRGELAQLGDSPQAQTVSLPVATESESISFASEVEGGSPAPTRQWQVRAPGELRFTDIEGETEGTLIVDAAREMDGYEYRALYTSDAGRIASEPARLTVNYAPQVVNEPADVRVSPGQSATFVAMPSGNPSPEVTWQVRVAGVWQPVDLDSDQFEVTGEQGGYLAVLDTNADLNGTKFRARLRNKITPGSDAWSTTYSRIATLSVNAPSEGGGGDAGGPVYFDTGSSKVGWGISERFRCYVTGSIARGKIELTGPVTQVAGTKPAGTLCQGTNPASGKPWGTGGEAFSFGLANAVFPGGSADPVSPVYDPATGKLRVDLGGTVRFLGHDYHNPNDSTPLLNTLFSNIRIEANLKSGEGVIYADAVGANMETPEPVTYTGVRLATFDASAITVDPQAGKVTIPEIPTVLHSEGAAIFGNYEAGSAMDPLSLELTVGEKPTRPADPPAGDDGDGAARPPAAKLKLRRAKALRARTVVAVVTCPKAAKRGCRIQAPKRVALRLRGKVAKLSRVQRRQLRRGARVVAPKRVAAGRRAQVALRLRAPQRRALRGKAVRATFRLRHRSVGGPLKAQRIRVTARIR